jgi:hypothetical protein
MVTNKLYNKMTYKKDMDFKKIVSKIGKVAVSVRILSSDVRWRRILHE